AESLFRAAQLIADRKDALARDMTREMGKVLDETRGDVQEAIDMTFFMAGEGRRQYGQTVPSELRDKFAMSVRQPLGVCAVVTPWNFPMAIPSWKIIPALVCGNTVVFKPATLTPLSAINFVRILEEAGIPPGVVNLVTGGGGDVGNALLVSEAVRVVSFTGSTDVGRTVSKHVEIGKKEGARLACGGHALSDGACANDFFHEPTVFADVDRTMHVAQEEIFGPVVSVIPCKSFDDAVAIGNGVQYGLSASIYTQDINRAFAAMRDMYTGIFYVNAPTIGAEVHLPFGGTKSTGNGHPEAGTAALDVFSEWKSVYVDFSGRLQRAQTDATEI